MSDLEFEVALALAPGIGPVRARNLLAHFGSARAIFDARDRELTRVPEVGSAAISALRSRQLLLRAEEEVKFILRNSLQAIFLTHPAYPDKLRQCHDAPLLLYSRGAVDFRSQRVVSVVGTRTATPYGKRFCEQMIAALAPIQPVIVSGLAYGIDVCAHRAAIANGISTVACFAHGLDRIYPSLHTTVAHEMLATGGWVTEFPSGTRPDRELFPMRNRIIAGLADCTVVIETDRSGGSMITAYLAHGYGREVFALPGRVDDAHSMGCNLLIRRNVAAILTSPDDLADYMGWKPGEPRQLSMDLLPGLPPPLDAPAQMIRSRKRMDLDQLAHELGLPSGELSQHLLELEFRGIIRSLPGKIFVPA